MKRRAIGGPAMRPTGFRIQRGGGIHPSPSIQRSDATLRALDSRSVLVQGGPLGERRLRQLVREYVAHYQGLDNRLIQPAEHEMAATGLVLYLQRLGGMLNCYYRAAAWLRDPRMACYAVRGAQLPQELRVAKRARLRILIAAGRVALAIVSTALAALGIEVALEIHAPTPEMTAQLACRQARAQQLNRPFDRRSRATVVAALRGSGVEAYPAPYHGMLSMPLFQETRERLSSDLTPLAGIAHTTAVMLNENGYYATYQSDKYGFNNPDDAWLHTPEVALVGDSYIHGMNVKQGEDVTSQLRALGWKALNLGVSDNGPLAELATLREYGRLVRPRHVVWAYYTNDLQDSLRDLSNKSMLRYLDPSFTQNLARRQRDIDALLTPFMRSSLSRTLEDERRVVAPDTRERLSSVIHLQRVRKTIKSVLQPDRGATLDTELGFLRKVLVAARQEVESWHGGLSFLILADHLGFASPDDPRNAYRARVAAIARDVGLPIIDFQAALRETGQPLTYYPFGCPGHYTAEGNRRLADSINAYLTTATRPTAAAIP